MSSHAVLVNRRLKACQYQNWKCYYCRQQMIDFRPKPQERKKQPANAATLEHLDDRFSFARGTMNGQIRRVAACFGCNNRRSQKRMKQLAEIQKIKSTLRIRGAVLVAHKAAA